MEQDNPKENSLDTTNSDGNAKVSSQENIPNTELTAKSVSFIILDNINDEGAENNGNGQVNSHPSRTSSVSIKASSEAAINDVPMQTQKIEEFKGRGILKTSDSFRRKKLPIKSATFTADTSKKKGVNVKEKFVVFNNYSHVQSKVGQYIKGDCDVDNLTARTHTIQLEEVESDELPETELTVASIVTVNESFFNPNYVWAHRVVAPKSDFRRTASQRANSASDSLNSRSRAISSAKSRSTSTNSPYLEERVYSRPTSRCSEFKRTSSRPISRCSDTKSICTRDEIDSTNHPYTAFSQSSLVSQPINIEKLARRLFKENPGQNSQELERNSPTPWSEDCTNSDIEKVKTKRTNTRVSSAKVPTRQNSAIRTSRQERTCSAPTNRMQYSLEKYSSERNPKLPKSAGRGPRIPLQATDQKLSFSNNQTYTRPFSCPAYPARQCSYTFHKDYISKSISKYDFSDKVNIASCLVTGETMKSELINEQSLNSHSLLQRSVDDLEFPEILNELTKFTSSGRAKSAKKQISSTAGTSMIAGVLYAFSIGWKEENENYVQELSNNNQSIDI
ncbi:hypothetical protein HDV01_007755 [Terramyces sp. JEL0728]|nr:hypothetical protein HDV01_007755 [Terramyces sp. JEL0728]